MHCQATCAFLKPLWGFYLVIVCKLVMEPIGEGNGNTLQCSCLESPVDRGAWWDVIYRVAQSWTRLKQLSSKQQQQWNPLKQGGTIIQGNANKHFVCLFLPRNLLLFVTYLPILSPQSILSLENCFLFLNIVRISSLLTSVCISVYKPLP